MNGITGADATRHQARSRRSTSRALPARCQSFLLLCIVAVNWMAPTFSGAMSAPMASWTV